MRFLLPHARSDHAQPARKRQGKWRLGEERTIEHVHLAAARTSFRRPLPLVLSQGTQYRSAIFYYNEQQKEEALKATVCLGCLFVLFICVSMFVFELCFGLLRFPPTPSALCCLIQERAQAKISGKIVTQIAPAQHFYKAEDYHQFYLFANPGGYCNHRIRDL